MFLVIIFESLFCNPKLLRLFRLEGCGEGRETESGICPLGEGNEMINWCRIRIESTWEAET